MYFTSSGKPYKIELDIMVFTYCFTKEIADGNFFRETIGKNHAVQMFLVL